MRRTKPISLEKQIKHRTNKKPEKKLEYDGNTETMISTGSTLLDLAISGGRVKGGGLPGGILVEIFGPSGSGKTVLLCEIAGAIQRQDGEIMFGDPEARLNKQFAKMFDLDTNKMNYSKPSTVTEVFQGVRNWKPKNNKLINGIFADSLAALSTDMELAKDEGDKMGGRRAKELSQETRKTCRLISQENYLMVCSNQIRQNMDATPFTEKYISPGGEAIKFYSTVRLRTYNPKKIKETITLHGKKIMKVIGVEIEVEVYKNSAWKPYRTAPITIIFDYGIDDIRQNLQFIKNHTKNNTYTVLGKNLSNDMDEAIRMIEKNNLESKLRFETIELWEKIESKFDSNRKRKIR